MKTLRRIALKIYNRFTLPAYAPPLTDGFRTYWWDDKRFCWWYSDLVFSSYDYPIYKRIRNLRPDDIEAMKRLNKIMEGV